DGAVQERDHRKQREAEAQRGDDANRVCAGAREIGERETQTGGARARQPSQREAQCFGDEAKNNETRCDTCEEFERKDGSGCEQEGKADDQRGGDSSGKKIGPSSACVGAGDEIAEEIGRLNFPGACEWRNAEGGGG